MNPNVNEKFNTYPPAAKKQLIKIRSLIFEVAEEHKLGQVEETLKWNEPSYLVKKGSTLRMDWKSQHPNQIGVYFNCKTSLIETIKEIYGNFFSYEGNRAIVFDLAKEIPFHELKHCISLSLRYHSIKQLPLLGG